jgi:hypothetical protein
MSASEEENTDWLNVMQWMVCGTESMEQNHHEHNNECQIVASWIIKPWTDHSSEQ